MPLVDTSTTITLRITAIATSRAIQVRQAMRAPQSSHTTTMAMVGSDRNRRVTAITMGITVGTTATVITRLAATAPHLTIQPFLARPLTSQETLATHRLEVTARVTLISLEATVTTRPQPNLLIQIHRAQLTQPRPLEARVAPVAMPTL